MNIHDKEMIGQVMENAIFGILWHYKNDAAFIITEQIHRELRWYIEFNTSVLKGRLI